MTIEERLRTGNVDPKYIRKKRNDPLWEYVVIGDAHAGIDHESASGVSVVVYHTIYRRPRGSKKPFLFHSHKRLEDVEHKESQ